MKTVIILLLVLALIFCLEIRFDLKDTQWIEKGTDRPIYVLYVTEEGHVKYKYVGDPFERTMSIIQLFTKYRLTNE